MGVHWTEQVIPILWPRCMGCFLPRQLGKRVHRTVLHIWRMRHLFHHCRQQQGNMSVEFNDGTVIHFSPLPEVWIGGILMGERMEYLGKTTFVYPAFNLSYVAIALFITALHTDILCSVHQMRSSLQSDSGIIKWMRGRAHLLISLRARSSRYISVCLRVCVFVKYGDCDDFTMLSSLRPNCGKLSVSS